jgi:hypothetical protein
MLTTGQVTFLLHLALGVVMVHGFAGGLATLLRPARGRASEAVRTVSTVSLAAAAWAAAITGTWLVYPGYRSEPVDEATTDPAVLVDHPKYALVADADTAVWHEFGMEWKEHVGWLVPILVTVVAYLAVRHRDLLARDTAVRRLAAGLLVVAVVGTVVAAGLGAVINAVAPNQFLAR